MKEPTASESYLPQNPDLALSQGESHRAVADDSPWATQMLDWYQLDGFPNFAYSKFLVPPDPLLPNPGAQTSRGRPKKNANQTAEPTTASGDERPTKS